MKLCTPGLLPAELIEEMIIGPKKSPAVIRRQVSRSYLSKNFLLLAIVALDQRTKIGLMAEYAAKRMSSIHITCKIRLRANHVPYFLSTMTLMREKILRLLFGMLNRRDGIFQKFAETKVTDKVIFFDRDNTLIHDEGYTFKIQDFRIIQKNIHYLKKLILQGWTIFVVSNQSAISRKLCSKQDVIYFNTYMHSKFLELGIEISGVTFCPHLRFCYCRKPNPGMLNYLIKEYSLNKDSVVMVGDTINDVKAGIHAGVRSFLLNDLNRELVFSSLLAGDK